MEPVRLSRAENTTMANDMNDDSILAKLDEVKAAIMAASVPFEHRWLDVEGVAALLAVSAGHFRDRIAPLPDFPKGRRFTGGHRRWKASEVDQWADRQHHRAA